MTSDDDYAYDAYLQGLYEEELMKIGSVKEQIERIQDYLCQYGDAVQNRVAELRNESMKLHDSGNYGSSLLYSAVAIELAIRFFLIKPILSGIILSDSISEMITNQILKNNTFNDREFLPNFLAHWHIDVNLYTLISGGNFWNVYKQGIVRARNLFMHEGKNPSEEISQKALECIEKILQIIYKFAGTIGFTLDKTGVWYDISEGKDIFTDSVYNKSSDPISPFKI